MFIPSWCTIKLGDLVILAPTEFLEDELVPPNRLVTMQPADYFRAAYKDAIGRKLVSHAFSFTRMVKFNTGLTARYYGQSHPAEMPIEPVDCTMTGVGGGSWLLKRAVLTSYQPKVYASRFTASYMITGGEYVVTTAPETPTGSDASDVDSIPAADRLTDGDGNTITDGAGNAIVI